MKYGRDQNRNLNKAPGQPDEEVDELANLAGMTHSDLL